MVSKRTRENDGVLLEELGIFISYPLFSGERFMQLPPVAQHQKLDFVFCFFNPHAFFLNLVCFVVSDNY